MDQLNEEISEIIKKLKRLDELVDICALSKSSSTSCINSRTEAKEIIKNLISGFEG